MSYPSFRLVQFSSKPCGYLAALLAAAVLTGCNVKEDPTGVIAITLKPGQTGTCESSPCAVSLVMPAGSGSYEVTANEVSVGTYPAGETANIGSFYQSQGIEIKGAGVPKTYVYISNSP